MKKPNLRPPIIRDKNGKVMKPEEFMKREAGEWGSAFIQFGKECFQGTGQFISECESGVSDFGRECAGADKKKKKKGK